MAHCVVHALRSQKHLKNIYSMGPKLRYPAVQHTLCLLSQDLIHAGCRRLVIHLMFVVIMAACVLAAVPCKPTRLKLSRTVALADKITLLYHK